MKKLYVFLIGLLLWANVGFGQCFLEVTLYSQAEVDNFATNYQCNELSGTLIIDGSQDITNLNGLSHLTRVGNLTILSNPNLANFSGINNITYIEGALTISGDFGTNLTGLFPSLTYVGGNVSFSGNSTTAISGFGAVDMLDMSLTVDNMPNLTSISGFDNLTSLNGLNISFNNSLTTLPLFPLLNPSTIYFVQIV